MLAAMLPNARAQSTNVVTGSISVAGEQDTYVFSLSTNAIFYFDVLTNVASVRWTLSGPQGLVASRLFTQTDGQSIGDPLLRLPPGDYSLTIDCSNDDVSGYAFRFVDLTSATLIVPGTVVSGGLSPANETDFYQFTASAGDRFVFDQISRVNLPNCQWSLVDPYGGILFGQNFADIGTVAAPVTLNASGTYTLMIEGYYGNTGSGTYSFNVSPQGNVPPVPFTGTPLTFGTLYISNLVANTTNSYIFTLSDRKFLMFDSQTNSPNLTWTLEGPPGIVVSQLGFNSSDGPNYSGSPIDLPAGTYQLRVRGTVANPYRLRLLDLSMAAAITPGTPVPGTLSPHNETDLYRFTASAGSRFYFDAVSSSGMPNGYWKLIDPFGLTLFSQNFSTDGPRRTLNVPGTYTVAIEGYHSEGTVGSYSFNVVPVTDGSQALTLGSIVDGTISSAGQLQNYTFSLSSATRLYFDSLTNVTLRWSLTGPTGLLVNNRGFASSDSLNITDPLIRVTPGDYTLTVSGAGDDVGNYRFRLFDVVTAAPMTPGTPVSSTLNPAKETDAYAFALATPGEYYMNGQAVSGLPNARQRLIDANGNFYVDNGLGTDTGPLNLRAGNYLLLVEGYHSDTGNGTYTFNLAPTSDSTQSTTIGNVIAGSLTAPGQTHNYTFSLATASRLYFDVLTNSVHQWSLRGPTGLLVNNRAFTGSDGLNLSNPLLDLPPGDYTLSIYASGDDVGAYGFRLLNTANATPLTPGVNVSGTLTPATEADIYRFSLAVPGEYFFDALAVSGLPNARERLVDAHGNYFVNTTLGNDVGPFNLPAGDYLVLVEGYYGESGNGSYTFNLRPVADGTQPLTLGNIVNGAITGPGQSQAYAFTLPAATTVCFDSLTNSSLQWRLSGPTGLLVNNRAFTASDAGNVTTPLLFLPPGNYTLTVYGADDTTGGYSFRLFDTDTAAPMTLGTPVSASLSPSYETDAYSFTLGAPTRVFFDVQAASSAIGSARKRLVDAYGRFYIDNAFNGDAGPLTLPAGDYLVLIEGHYNDTGSGNYTFNLAPVNDGSQPLALDTTITGNISAAGQVQAYTFTLPSAARLYFDSFTNTSARNWSLSGPTGSIVNNRGFNGSDAQSVGNPILDLPAGDYRLRVFGDGDSTGAYQFNLRDFASGALLTPGTPVTVNNFPGNMTQIYRFSAAAGDRFFFDHISNANLGSLYWRLINPYNAIIFARNLNSDAGTNVLGAAGTYTLLIEGYIGETTQGTYSFNVQPEGNVPPPTLTGTPLTIGAVVGGTLATATSTNAYTFSLAAPTRLYFDALTNSDFRWTLRGPPGVIVNNQDFQISDGYDAIALLDLTAGNYQLTITGLAGDYQFRLLDFANATPYTPGTSITNTLAPGRSTALFRFAGTAGDRMFFDGRPTSGLAQQTQVRLYAPVGNVLLDQNIVDDAQTFTLLQSGTYTLAVEGRISENAASGTYSFNLQPVVDATNALTIGATVSGNIATVGQIQYYTFTLPASARLYFDALTYNDFYWRLDAPRGEIVPWRSFPTSDAAEIANPVLSLDAGTYTIGIAAQNFAFTGAYQFRVLNLGTGTAYTPGTSVTNTLAPARSTALYRFTGSAGQRVFFDGRPTTVFSHIPYARIVAPLGNVVMAEYVNNDVQTFTLPQSGDYTLAVEGRIYDNNASGTYAFNLQPVTHVTNALTIGALNGATITTVGQTHYYTFSLPSAARLYFDALTYAADFYWRLDAQWGEVVPWRSFDTSDAAEIANPMLSLPPGNYTLAVAENNFASTGSYQFRLLDFEDATAFTPGTVVTNALTPNRSTKFYEFVANAGDKMYFDGLPNAGFSHQPQTRIYAPLGNIVMDTSVNTDVGTFTLPQSGTYKLTVEGRIYDNGPGTNFAFNLQPVVYPTNALTIGATTGGTIATLGQGHYYTFTLAAPARLYFDALTYSSSSDFYWRLDAQAGAPNVLRQVVDWRAFASSDASEVSNPLLALEAGSYLLQIAPASFSFTGDYQFRLLDFATATPMTPGTIVNGVLAPNRSTVFHRFNASAGDRFYFDGRPSSGYSHQPYVRLYAPLGNVVMEQSVNGDVDTFTVPQAGNYVVTVEGRIYDPGTNGTYSFNVAPNPQQPGQPLFETNNSPDLIVSAVSVAPASGLQSGDTATVHWTVQNSGNVVTAGSFTDRVTVRNTASGQIIVNSTLAYNESDPGNGPIAPLGTRARQLNVTLPDGTNGTGNLEVTVTTDALNNIVELNSGGTGEANNSASTTITTTLAPYPDLLVHSVTATPPTGWLPGSPVTVAWRLTNAGPRAASTSWVDSVVVRNTNTSYVFSTTTNYVLSEAGNGAIAPNGTRDRSITFLVPNNANAYGGFEITVATDSASQVFELNGAGTAETNNSRTALVRNAPDLRIVGLNVTGSPEIRSGANITATWNTTNEGTVETGGQFSDRVVIRNNTTSEILLDTTVLYNPATAGPIGPGQSRPRSRAFLLPEGPRGAGQIEVIVTADTSNQLLELNAAGTGEANNLTSTTVTSALTPDPDLRVSRLVVPPTGSVGESISIVYSVTNAGPGTAAADWTDRLYLSSNATLDASDTFLTAISAAAFSPLASSGVYSVTQSVVLPSSAVGTSHILVFADALLNQREVDDSNNVAAAVVQVDAPDLQVANLAITPPSLTSGTTMLIQWNDTNSGSGAARRAWYDRVLIENTTRGQTLLDTTLYYDVNANGPLTNGRAAPRQYSYRLPDGTNGAGNIRVTIQADYFSSLFEHNVAGQGESNNVAVLTRTSTLGTYADLTVTNIVAPTSGLPGQQIDILWTVRNEGNAIATAPWTEQVFLSDDTVVGSDQFITAFSQNSDLAIGASITRTQRVTLPSFGTGNKYFVVRADAGNNVFELNETNNTRIDSDALVLPSSLTFVFNLQSFSEATGSNVVQGTVSRNTDTASQLTVTLSSGNTNAAIVPATVNILAGQASASFFVRPVDDALVDGPQTAIITATASGFSPVSSTLTVTDDDTRQLVLQLGAASVAEGAAGPVLGYLTRNANTNEPLVVSLRTDDLTKLSVTNVLTMAPGERAATFNVLAIDNDFVDGNRRINVFASATNYNAVSAGLDVIDDDNVSLSLAIADASIAEGAPTPATIGMVTRSPVNTRSLSVNLSVSPSSELSVPVRVTIPANQASASFNINARDDGFVNGTRTAVLTARPVTDFGVIIETNTASANIEIRDNDGPTLTVAIDTAILAEGDTAIGTVTRNTPTGSPLTVTLSSSAPDEAQVPPAVTIPIGQASATFTVNGQADSSSDGLQPVTITATAAGFNSGSANVTVSDIDVPDLRISSLTVPTNGLTDGRVTVVWTVINNGLVPAAGSWSDSILISTDNQLGGDTLLSSVNFIGSLDVGQSYTRTQQVLLPSSPGRFWIIAATDAGDTVIEGSERNNVLAQNLPLVVAPSYRASVETDVTHAAAGTPIPLHGRATNSVDGTPARFKLVTVRIHTMGTRRTINALANANGEFNVTFQPLPNEAGLYSAGADHPLVLEDEDQDFFTILGMRATPEAVNLRVVPNETVTGQIEIRNRSEIPLAGLTVAGQNVHSSLNVQLSISNQLAGSSSIFLQYSITADYLQQATFNFNIHVQSGEGATLDIPVSVAVVPLRPVLIANPSFLDRGMLRGAQTIVAFEVANRGGAPSGPLDVLLPDVPWMSLLSSNTIPSIAPGTNVTVTLALNPATNLALQRYDGALVLSGPQSGLNMPFQFRALSDAVGDLRVIVQDEYTFFVADGPKVTNATVRVRDAISGNLVAEGLTGDSGEVLLSNIPEGAYSLEVTADRHSQFRGTVNIVPAVTTTAETFISRQTVTYRWSVVPIEIEDTYRIVLESVFETEVPIPNVVVEDPFIMPWVVEGQTTQFEIKLRNEGLIAANGVRLNIPNDPNYIITPLIDEIGVLPAKTSMTIPVTIRHRATPAPGLARALNHGGVKNAAGGGGGCELEVHACLPKIPLGVTYYYVCGPNNVLQARPVDLSPVCTAKAAYDCYQAIKGAGEAAIEAGNLAKASCEVIDAILTCAGAELSECQKAALQIACRTIVGGITGGVAGAGAGAASGLGDSLGCLCQLISQYVNISATLPPASLSGGGFSGWSLNFAPYAQGFGGSFSGGSGNCSSPASPAFAQAASLNSVKTAAAPPSSAGVCARVRIRIEQEAVMTRAAFLGSLEIENEGGSGLTGIRVDLDFRDENGNSVSDRFAIRGPQLTGLSDVAGGGTIASGGSGSAKYTFIPTREAAPTAPAIYRIGGTLRYIENGVEVVAPLLSSTITVFPEARMQLTYFQQRDVFSDDPFTDIVEPAEPFSLGLIAKNIGAGAAKNFRITSAQPEIIENQKGLLIDFKIIGTKVGAQELSPSLTANLGNIPPGGAQVAQWSFLSSLQGKFIEYSATFEHVDSLGGANLSLIEGVSIHELIHPVRADRVGDDAVPDFLVNDEPDPDNLPDRLYLSDGSEAVVNLSTNPQVDGPVTLGDFQVTLTAFMSSGWNYFRLSDPGPGYRLYRVVRSDGREMRVGDNVWTTDRTFPASQAGARREHTLHLLDFNGTGRYTLYYRLEDSVAPVVLDVVDVVPDLQTAPVASVDVVLSEPIDLTTFTHQDITLTLNGGPNLITSGVTVSVLSNATYRINGLAALTGADGNYELTVLGAGIRDYGDNVGTNIVSEAWAKGAISPVVVTVGPVTPDPRTAAISAVDVAFSRPINAATFTEADLALTRNGSAVPLGGISITTLSSNAFRISGLDSLTSAEGAYALTVRAVDVQDTDGNLGLGALTDSWTTDTTRPSIASIEQIATDPRNIAVQTLDVTFSEPIDAATFDWHDVILTRNGGPNLITSDVGVARLDALRYRINNFNWVVGNEGTYTLTVNAAAISDLAGNAGLGSASESWVMDTTRPATPSNLAINPDRGISSTDGLSNTNAPLFTGTLGETNLSVRLFDVTTSADLGYALVTGTTFSKQLDLTAVGAHRIRARATDSAANVSDAFFNIFIDLEKPEIALQPVVPNPRTNGVTSLDVTFSEPINPSTFQVADLSLTRDGGTNIVTTNVVSIQVLASNLFRINGLQSLTAPIGIYELVVNAAGIEDLAGNPGLLSATNTWQRAFPNTAPRLAVAPSRSVNEGSLLSFVIVATDTDVPTNTLVFTLAPGAPSGATIDPLTGEFTWMPSESQGPQIVTVNIRCTDDGTPNLTTSTNVTITVNEVNQRPLLAAVPNQFTFIDHLVAVTNVASDPDIPANTLTFSLGSGAPAGLAIGPASGIVAWRPGAEFAGTTNPVSVIVTDNGVPALSRTNTFLIIVGDYLELIVGRTVMQAGQTSSVPISVETSTSVTNVTFAVDLPSARLTNATLQALLPGVTATLQPAGTDRVQLLLRAATALPSGQPLASLGFVAPSNQPSAIIPLLVSNAQALQASGVVVPRVFAQDGRVVIVGAAPSLEATIATNGQRMLMLYGRPGVTYDVESTPSLNPVVLWTQHWRGGVTNLVQPITPETNQMRFYRARRP